ncbi:MAG: hypothetical protein WA005_14750 [Candidatus Binataceae bacterium]
MEAPFPRAASLSSVLGIIATAHTPRAVAVVIDQFEDAIPILGAPSASELLGSLVRAHSMPLPNLRILLSYRGDADAKVGRYWQTVSGSASGLPRYYLEALSEQPAGQILLELLQAQFGLGDTKSASKLVSIVVQDLVQETRASGWAGVYPPFLQMVAETLIRSGKEGGTTPSEELYRSLGGAHEIIGRYLISQLRFLGPEEKHARALLVALAGKSGRQRKSVDQLARERELETARVCTVLERLASLRMVREQDGAWEIVHDFLNQRVLEELSNPEEQEARTFRDLLIAKTAAFATTGELLTERELLAVYAHRTRIRCSRDEIMLLLASASTLSGPVQQYLTQVPAETAVSWAKNLLSYADGDAIQNATRFLLACGVTQDLPFLAEVFGGYRLQGELAGLIRNYAKRADLPLLLKLRNRRAEQVAQAARESIAELASPSDVDILRRLLRSDKPEDLRVACRVLLSAALPEKCAEYVAGLKSRSMLDRASAMCCLGAVGSARDTKHLRRALFKSKGVDSAVCSYALAHWSIRETLRKPLLDLLRHPTKRVRVSALAAFGGGRAGISIRELLKLYEDLPDATARAVIRSVDRNDRNELHRFVKNIALSPTARDLLIALVRVGGNEEARFVLNLVSAQDASVSFWNVPLLAAALADATDSSSLKWLKQIAENEEFWRYVGRDRGKNPLPVKNHENVYLFKRLAAACLVRACDESEWDLLRRLVFHDYWLIGMAAARRIAQFATERHLNELISHARAQPKELAPATMSGLRCVDEAVYGSAPARSLISASA